MPRNLPQALPSVLEKIGHLAEPTRRIVYLYLSSRGEEVSREQVSKAVGIPRAMAAFHLDKLASEGLVEVSYRRLSGRSGPGAGRPSKMYRRSGEATAVSLPHREYGLASDLLARAVDQSDTARERLMEEALNEGRARGLEQRSVSSANDRLFRCLADAGYEPLKRNEGLRLRNCPFHSLKSKHRALVCEMNLCLISGMVEGSDVRAWEPCLEPSDEFCCVALRRKKKARQASQR